MHTDKKHTDIPSKKQKGKNLQQSLLKILALYIDQYSIFSCVQWVKRVGVITSPRLGIGHARSPIHNAALRQQPQQIVSQYLHTEMGLDDSGEKFVAEAVGHTIGCAANPGDCVLMHLEE